MSFNIPLDMEEGFNQSTPSQPRQGTSAAGMNWTTGTVPPPPKGKQKQRFREPATEDESDSDKTDKQKPKTQQSRPGSGYGLHSMGPGDESMENRAGPRIIKEPGLVYDGTNFNRFLARFERVAKAFQATDYDKALQIWRFVRKEELKLELEAMDGYETCNWTELRSAMVESWGELDNTILYIPNNLIKLAGEYSKNGGLKDYREYKAYYGKFSAILKYLVDNEHINKKQDASLLFISAFSKESQKNIKRILVSQGRIPKAKDGSSKPPLWEHVKAAAETEIRVEEEGYFAGTDFGEANRLMQKNLNEQKGDSKRREQMIAENLTGGGLEKKVDKMAQVIATLQQKLASTAPATYNQNRSVNQPEFSRGNTRPSMPLYESQNCYYCHKEGHGTFRCGDLMKDEEQGLVKRNGKDWYLPNGQHIPWNPSRPIRSVIATSSADPNMLEHVRKLAEEKRQTSGQTPQIMKSSAQAIDWGHWEPPTLGAESFLRNHAITRSEAQRGRRGVRIQEPEPDRMEIDQEEEIADLDLGNTRKEQ